MRFTSFRTSHVIHYHWINSLKKKVVDLKSHGKMSGLKLLSFDCLYIEINMIKLTF